MRVEVLQAVIDLGIPVILALMGALLILVGVGVLPKWFQLDLGEHPNRKKVVLWSLGAILLILAAAISLISDISKRRQPEGGLVADHSKLEELQNVLRGRDNAISSLKRQLQEEREQRLTAQQDAQTLLQKIVDLRERLDAANRREQSATPDSSKTLLTRSEESVNQTARVSGGVSSDKEHKPLINNTTVWEGRWTDRSGYIYDGIMTVTLDTEGAGTGNILWTLVETPAQRLSKKIGLSGTEHFEGTFNADQNALIIKGYRLEDPHGMLALGNYRLVFSEDLDGFKEQEYPFGFVGQRKR